MLSLLKLRDSWYASNILSGVPLLDVCCLKASKAPETSSALNTTSPA